MAQTDVTATIKIDGYEDARRLGIAVELLKQYAEMHQHREVLEFVDDAEDSLQNLSIESTQGISPR